MYVFKKTFQDCYSLTVYSSQLYQWWENAYSIMKRTLICCVVLSCLAHHLYLVIACHSESTDATSLSAVVMRLILKLGSFSFDITEDYLFTWSWELLERAWLHFHFFHTFTVKKLAVINELRYTHSDHLKTERVSKGRHLQLHYNS